MKHLITLLGLVMLFNACALKGKRQLKKREVYEKTRTSELSKTVQTENKSLLQRTDSTHNQQWLKIYPKGEFVFRQDGFVGEADSLLWRMEGFRLEQLLRTKEDQTKMLTAEKSIDVALVNKEENLLQKTKVSFSWFKVAAIGVGLMLLLAFLLKKRLRIFT